jgi:hypothetical protein
MRQLELGEILWGLEEGRFYRVDEKLKTGKAIVAISGKFKKYKLIDDILKAEFENGLGCYYLLYAISGEIATPQINRTWYTED